MNVEILLQYTVPMRQPQLIFM